MTQEEYDRDYTHLMDIDAVIKNWEAIEYIQDPSEAVQLAAVTENGYAIQYISNPSEKVKRSIKDFRAFWKEEKIAQEQAQAVAKLEKIRSSRELKSKSKLKVFKQNN